MRISCWQPAGLVHVPGKGDFPERFAPGAFDSVIGTEVPMTLNQREIGRATVISADVDDDGSGVMLTLETEFMPPAGTHIFGTLHDEMMMQVKSLRITDDEQT